MLLFNLTSILKFGPLSGILLFINSGKPKSWFTIVGFVISSAIEKFLSVEISLGKGSFSFINNSFVEGTSLNIKLIPVISWSFPKFKTKSLKNGELLISFI